VLGERSARGVGDDVAARPDDGADGLEVRVSGEQGGPVPAELSVVDEAAAPVRRRDALAEQTAVLLERIHSGTVDETERQRLVDEIVLLNLPVARSLAMRYRERGVPVEDLMQVAALGLVKAANGFDAERGRDFMAYAAPTITGEIKRHFRDTGWAVRPPRRLQELRTRVATTTQSLSQASGRSPTVKELAEALEVSQEDVVEAMVSSNGYATASLDAPPDGESGSWADTVADPDTTLATTPDRLALQQTLAKLPERERRILALRFFADKTQSEIGAEIGVTQMQVSRLLSRALQRLREQLEDEPGAGRP
jgi:RNA polymerase sigma-B factor